MVIFCYMSGPFFVWNIFNLISDYPTQLMPFFVVSVIAYPVLAVAGPVFQSGKARRNFFSNNYFIFNT